MRRKRWKQNKTGRLRKLSSSFQWRHISSFCHAHTARRARSFINHACSAWQARFRHFTRSASRVRFSSSFVAFWRFNSFLAISGFSLCDHPNNTKKRRKRRFCVQIRVPKSLSVHAGFLVVVVVVEVVVVSVSVAISTSKSAGQENLNIGRIKGSSTLIT